MISKIIIECQTTVYISETYHRMPNNGIHIRAPPPPPKKASIFGEMPYEKGLAQNCSSFSLFSKRNTLNP